MTKDTLTCKQEDKEVLSRSTKRWINELHQNNRILGVDNAEKLANNRVDWRCVVWNSDDKLKKL